MKRVDNIFYKICSLENLRLADEIARRGKKKKAGVKFFDLDRERNLERLHYQLLAGEYHTSQYHHFEVRDPKRRTIAALPYYPDRIVHQAIVNVLGPIWDRVFIADTFACIKGRGTHAVRRRTREFFRRDPEGTRYCLKVDIHHYYQSIDHDILKAILRRKIKDARCLALLDEIVDSYPEGIPIGNWTSSYFANLYLSYEVGHYLKEVAGVKYMEIYMDDISIFAGSKEELHRILAILQQQLGKLKLTLKGNYQIFPVEDRGVDFLGFVFRHDYILLRKRIKRAIFRKISKFRKKHISARNKRLAVASYIGWLKYTDSINLKHKLNTFAYAQIF